MSTLKSRAVLTDHELRTMKPLLGIREAAVALQMSVNRAYALENAGEFPVEVVRIGRRRYYRRADILRFLGIEAAQVTGDAA